MNLGPVIAGSYDFRLVTLSFVISFVTSYTALDLTAQVKANTGYHRLLWLTCGACAMGGGIWCMHYTGMLAFRLPIAVYYHVPTVIASLLAAIVASFVALIVVSRTNMTLIRLVGGSLLMGSGIGAMHYTGMAAMRLQAMHVYNPALLVLSIAVAVTISFAGLLIIFNSTDERGSRGRKIAAALALGMAIPIMHYTGMASVHFVPWAGRLDLSNSVNMSDMANLGILTVTILVLGFTLFTSVLDRRLSAQERTLESERKMMRALIDNMPDLMYVKDAQGRFLIANPQVARALGAGEPEELLGKTESEVLGDQNKSASLCHEERVTRTGQPAFNQEETVRDGRGGHIPVLMTIVPLRDNDGQISGVAGVGHNISERKKSEQALLAAERKYHGMFDQALFGMFEVGLEGRLLSMNPAMVGLLGYETREEMLRTFTAPLWSIVVSAERRADLESALKERGNVRAFEMEVYCKDNNKLWISTTVRATMNEGVHVGYEGMCEDTTERRFLREQLLHAQKLESVGQLAAGVAHEINTPTQYIGDNVRFLKKSFAALTTLLNLYAKLWQAICDDELTANLKQELGTGLGKIKSEYLLAQIPKAIDDGLEGVKRVSDLVSAMKEFSHPGTKEKVPVDLNRAIESTVAVARNEWKYVADLETDFDRTLPRISCLPGELNQVILNLIVNAAHAIEDQMQEDKDAKGKIGIKTSRCPTGVEIRISDTGTGIPVEVRDRIFDPFFTTKDIGKGTGQGLAIARSVIVDKHGGSIDFETRAGEGTSFVVRLPHAWQHDAVPESALR
jgi:PAS domain S-box-containing protein